MITFLVTGDFILNAQYLSDIHLGKQRVEAIQILDALITGKGWIHHPMTKAWANFEIALKYYINCIIEEWIKRGKNNNLELYDLPDKIELPWWTQWDKLHYSHQAMLNRKNPFHYHFEVPDEYLDHGYIWPDLVEDPDLSIEELASPIPDELLEPVFCQAILKSGLRKDDTCNVLIKDGYEFCKRHLKREPVFCTATLKKGGVCNRQIKFYGQDFCKIHSK